MPLQFRWNLLEELGKLCRARARHVGGDRVVEHERVQEIVAHLRLLARRPLRGRRLLLESVQQQQAGGADAGGQQPEGEHTRERASTQKGRENTE